MWQAICLSLAAQSKQANASSSFSRLQEQHKEPSREERRENISPSGASGQIGWWPAFGMLSSI